MTSPYLSTFLSYCYETDFFNLLDRELALFCIQEEHNPSEALLFFLCTLIKSAREGHVALKDMIYTDMLPEHYQENAHRLFLLGREEAKKYAVCVEDPLLLPPPIHPLVQWGEYTYLYRLWKEETLLLQEVKKKITEPSLPLVDHEKIAYFFSQVAELLPEQKEAVERALSSSLFILYGGPGSGKTFTIRMLMSILTSYTAQNVALAAPTGKAAAHLEEQLKNSVFVSSYTVSTLHALLRENLFKEFEEDFVYLPHDFVIVDEASMIDLHLLRLLFFSLKPTARLILVGDPEQLPAVEAGSLFYNLIELIREEAPNKMGCLRGNQRTKKQGLLALTSIVREQNSEAFLSYLTTPSSSFSFYDMDLLSPKEIESLLIEQASAYFFHEEQESAENVLDSFQRFRILSSTNKGSFGTVALNTLFYHEIRRRSKKRWYFPVILQRSDYDLKLFNGEIGIQEEDITQSFSFCYFPKRKILSSLLPTYTQAFVISIHKSQGSEYDNVSIVLPESTYFGLEALYTAITRARHHLSLFASKKTLLAMIRKKTTRHSGFVERFFHALFLKK